MSELKAPEEDRFLDRVEQLEKVNGLYGTKVKAPFEEIFFDCIEQLRKVKELYGTCNDKESILGAFPDIPSLYLWVNYKRKCIGVGKIENCFR